MVPSKDWGKIIERMPDDAPPKWMFNLEGDLPPI
jgi:hypothetical protein